MSKFLTDKFEEALVYAAQLHGDQTRKRSAVPYVAHLLGVTSLVLEDGGNEDEAIAALLHDAVEDQGGLGTLSEIEQKFGSNVAEIVDGLTDAYTQPKPPWKKRKEAYLDSLRFANPSVIRVSLADKVYNARATLRDIRREGEAGWDRFNGGKQGTLWYYHRLIQEFEYHGSRSLLFELTRIVDELEKISSD